MYNSAVIIPSLNPDDRLIDLISELVERDIAHILVINDGSSEKYDQYFKKAAAYERCTVLKHSTNMGKGRALKTAFEYVLQNLNNLDGVVTADADGQHTPADIVKVCEKLSEGKEIVLGMRDFHSENVPFRSLFGNRLTSRLFQLLYGTYIEDTQTGLRGLPMSELPWIKELRGERFDFELNMLINAGKHRVNFSSVKVDTLYFDNNSGSHYKAIRDSARVFICLISGLAQYSLTSFASSVLDVGSFLILNSYVFENLGEGHSIFYSTLGARIVSSFLNFSMNRRIIFGSNKSYRRSMIRYYLLWFFQLMSSYLLVYGFNQLWNINAAIIKLVVDLLLASMSYQIQLHWVFGKNCRVDFNEE